MHNDRDSLLRKLHELRSEHRDLDTVIARLVPQPADQLQVQRLKKRKLLLKDEIAWLESRPHSGQHRLMDRPHSDRAALVRIGIIMGSQSDWPTLRHAADTWTPWTSPMRPASSRLIARRIGWPSMPGAAARGLHVIIAGAGGAAHLPGMAASWTRLPVLGVPVESQALSGMDSLLSIVQMPAGVPVGTLAIGRGGAVNAAILAVSILALHDAGCAARLDAWRNAQTQAVALAPQDA